MQSLKSFYRLKVHTALRTRFHRQHAAHERSVRMWYDGREAFPRIHRLLRSAEHMVIVHMYNWKEDSTGIALAETLIEIADRGVQVEIVKETTGDMFELDKDFQSTRKSASRPWKKFWNHPHISVHFTSDENHSKVFIIDNTILLIGGINMSDDYKHSWDYLLELHGQDFVQSYLTQGKHSSDTGVSVVLNTQYFKNIRADIERLIQSASSTIVLQHSYLGDARIRSMLALASHRGVSVTLYIPEKADMCQNVNLEFVEKLVQLGKSTNIAVRLLPGFVHGKLLIVDGKNICVGSANLMTYSLDHMGETNVTIEKQLRLHRKLRWYMRYMYLKSTPLISMPRRGIRSRLFAKLGL